MKNYDEFKQKYQVNLNSQQEKALLSKKGQTLLLAVPGSGKTTVIINRIAYLVKVKKISPSSILTLTFSRMGARDLKNRYEQKFGEEALQFNTIHSFSLSVIRHYERQYRRKAFEVLANNTQVIKKLYLQLFKGYPSETELNEIVQRIGYVKNMMLSQKEIEKMPPLEIDFYKIFKAYEKYKQESGMMDFDDLLKYTYGLLKRHPEMLCEFQKRYQYIQLDEAQDTSKIQFKIIELLTGKKGNLFLVGDEDQSIYGFRGAYPEFLLSFKKIWPEGEVLLMETNYRSTQAIVKRANNFIRLNSERYEKKMVTSNLEGVPIKREWVKRTEDQYRLILESIRREGKETAVLYRNNESAIPLVDLLDREGIPFRIKEHNPTFFNHFILKDIQSFYEFSKFPNDLELFSEIYYKMDLAISKEMIEKLKIRGGESVLHALVRGSREKPWLKTGIERIEKTFKQLRTESPKEGIRLILDELGYRAYLQFRIGSGQSEEGIAQKLAVLKILAGRSEHFLDYFEHLEKLNKKLQETRIYHEKKPAVTLSTFHSSKGLEFEKVFIIDAIDGQIPTAASREDPSVYSEEVRLFYVAATRAKKELSFICMNDKKNGIFPSPFIGYLIDGITHKKSIEKRKETPESFGVKKKPAPGQGKKNILAISKSVEAKNYQIGAVLVHRRFGKGKIIEKNGTVATVCFEEIGNKKMNIAVCLENGVIE